MNGVDGVQRIAAVLFRLAVVVEDPGLTVARLDIYPERATF